MLAKTYQVPYSQSTLEFSLPDSMQVSVVESNAAEPLDDIPRCIQAALDYPTGSTPLRELAKPGQRACIVFTDITRPTPDHLLVPALLGELKKAGLQAKDITLLCATGMHRASTCAEKVARLGADILTEYRVLDNQAQNPAACVEVGVTSCGTPIQIHRAAVEADLLIATGIVEPHQFAGYSGGRKTVAIGAAGEGFIAYTHAPQFIDHPGARLGRLAGNPFHEVISEAARHAGLKFIFNVVLDDKKRILRLMAGGPEQTFNELVAFARSVYEVPIPHQFDLVIGGVGFPKDSNLYQASRAASYLFFAPIPVVRPGGFLIIPARCEEGAGNGIGERRFLKTIREAPDLQFILDDARENGYPPGGQRAFVMAKVLEETRVIIVGSECPQLVKDCKMIPMETMSAALKLAEEELGSECATLIVPHSLQTLPIISSA